MASYSRIFHHITVEDVKRNERERNALEKIEEFKEEEIIEPVKHVDWRSELKESDWTNTTTGNKVASTFTHSGSGDTFTHSAIGGVIPSTTEVGGETVAAPTESQYDVLGYAPLMQWDMQREESKKSTGEMNQQLDSSEDYAKKIEADALMKARLDDIDYFKQEHSGMDMSHGYSLPPKFLDDWATKTKFTGDMRTLWDGKTRTWKLGGRRVDNQGRTVSMKDITTPPVSPEDVPAFLDKVAKNPKLLDNLPPGMRAPAKQFLAYLTNKPGKVEFSRDEVKSAFSNLSIDPNRGTLSVSGDPLGMQNVNGGEDLTQLKDVNGNAVLNYNYDFQPSDVEMAAQVASGHLAKYEVLGQKFDVNNPIHLAALAYSDALKGGAYGRDSAEVPGAGWAITGAKMVGGAQPTKGSITMSMSQLKQTNLGVYNYLIQNQKKKKGQ